MWLWHLHLNDWSSARSNVCQPAVIQWHRRQAAAMQLPLGWGGCHQEDVSCQLPKQAELPSWTIAQGCCCRDTSRIHIMFCSSLSRRWLPLARISCIAIGDIVNVKPTRNLAQLHVKLVQRSGCDMLCSTWAEASCVWCKHA